MQALHNRHGIKTYRSTKQEMLGSQTVKPPPAWRTASGSKSDGGSKILLSRLPPDVEENEVEILFAKTVGAVKEVIMAYNSQGRSRGMAVVTFARSTDAAVARAKYNGKIVDGKEIVPEAQAMHNLRATGRPIKIEIVTDDDHPRAAASLPATTQLSLIERLGPKVADVQQHSTNGRKANAQQPMVRAIPPALVGQPKTRIREKSGARRLKKQRAQQQVSRPLTAADLDAQMEEYRSKRVPIKVSESMA